jgi:allantoicase
MKPRPSAALLLKDPALWSEVVPKSPLKGGGSNLFPVKSLRPWTHLRLNIFPDGGVARLRAYGDVVPDWERLAKSVKPVDLAAIENGALVLGSSDMFFGKAANMLMPGRAANMGDGWETKRRRGPGHDWCVIKLGASGLLQKIEVDTSHFKGNYPDSFSLEACSAPGADLEALRSGDTVWTEVLPQTKLAANKRHLFAKELKAFGPFTHARLAIYPDGGVSRLRILGRVDRRGPA